MKLFSLNPALRSQKIRSGPHFLAARRASVSFLSWCWGDFLSLSGSFLTLSRVFSIPRDDDWCPGPDGYDGDGQGVRFRQAAAAPQGKTPYSAPQAKKICLKRGRREGILPCKAQKQTL